MREFKHAVYIGRFQPFHDGHLEVVRYGLEIADQVIIVVGSANAAANIKNPWTFEERKRMIQAAINDTVPVRERGVLPAYWDRVHIVGVRDYYYNENAWISEVQAKTDEFIQDGDAVALLGAYKDSSSYYLKHFPQWEFMPKHTNPVAGTAIRERLFRETPGSDWEGKAPTTDLEEFVFPIINDHIAVPTAVKHFLRDYVTTKRYVTLCREFAFITDYQSQWANSPFPPMFVTTDAVVVCSGHVLVVKRKHNPGKGLYALPGGFLRAKEKIEAGMLRELKEETGIKVDRLILESSIEASNVFDHPDRSLRGRTISHGFLIKLKDGKLPEVRGNDDAERAFWMPLMDVGRNEDKFFEDHAHIITYFLNLGTQGGC